MSGIFHCHVNLYSFQFKGTVELTSVELSKVYCKSKTKVYCTQRSNLVIFHPTPPNIYNVRDFWKTLTGLLRGCRRDHWPHQLTLSDGIAQEQPNLDYGRVWICPAATVDRRELPDDNCCHNAAKHQLESRLLQCDRKFTSKFTIIMISMYGSRRIDHRAISI